MLKAYGECRLIVTLDADKHKKQFLTHLLTHREKLLDYKAREFTSARLVQDYLTKEAKRLGISILDNRGEFVPLDS